MYAANVGPLEQKILAKQRVKQHFCHIGFLNAVFVDLYGDFDLLAIYTTVSDRICFLFSNIIQFFGNMRATGNAKCKMLISVRSCSIGQSGRGLYHDGHSN